MFAKGMKRFNDPASAGLSDLYWHHFHSRFYRRIFLSGDSPITSILFGICHFPFAFYLWEDVSGNAINSLKMIMTEHVVAGVAFGLLYDKSNQNLWSSILLHSLSNAAIMALGVGVL